MLQRRLYCQIVKNIGNGRQVETWSVLSANDCAVDQSLTTAHVLLDFNSPQRKGFWSVHTLVCYNLIILAQNDLSLKPLLVRAKSHPQAIDLTLSH